MDIFHNVDLKPYNTFCISVKAKTMVVFEQCSHVLEFINSRSTFTEPFFVLGNGSNTLFTSDVNGTILLNKIRGIKKAYENEDNIYIKVASGESWNDFVTYCVEHNWGGVENLVAIPGSVGASAVQNIGAYDMEVKDAIIEVTAIDLKTGVERVFSQKECAFDYRLSIFKNERFQHFIITHITYCLQKKPALKTSYKALHDVLQKKNISTPTIRDVYETIKDIRKNKLPDEKIVPNAGSFFKNPVTNLETALAIKQKFKEIPLFELPNEMAKLSAAWMIEQCGFKGFRAGDAGVHDKQALVLVNYGTATGQEIQSISKLIIAAVYKKFGITLAPEVVIKP